MDLVSLRELLEEALVDTAPNFEIYVSTSGEIMIATGLTETDDGELIEVDREEDEEIDPDLEPLDEVDMDDDE